MFNSIYNKYNSIYIIYNIKICNSVYIIFVHNIYIYYI